MGVGKFAGSISRRAREATSGHACRCCFSPIGMRAILYLAVSCCAKGGECSGLNNAVWIERG